MSCSQNIQKKDTSTAALFINQVHRAFCVDHEHEIEALLINKDRLIHTLIGENNQFVYQYDSVFFNMATTPKEYINYQTNILDKFYKIKKIARKNKLNWNKSSIQKATYNIDSLQINLKGVLVIIDKHNRKDSIHFEAIKLQNNWSLTTLY
jgi:hypothetical protein